MPDLEDADFRDTLCGLATLIAAYSNPQMFPFDIGTLPEAERLAELETLKNMMGEMIG